MNINKYNIKYYLNNNSSTSLDTHNKSRKERTNVYTRSRNLNRRQSFSNQTDEYKGKNSVLLSSTTFAKTQNIFHQNKKNSIDLFTENRRYIKHNKKKSENDSSIMFPIINEISQSDNNKHQYSFDNKRKRKISLLSDRYIRNSSDSNSSLKIISDNGSIRKSSLNKNQLFIDDTDDDHFIINKQLTLQIGNKHKKRKKLSRYAINSKHNPNIKSIKLYNEDNSSENKQSLELGNISNVNIIQNTKSKFILRKQPLTLIHNNSRHKKRQSFQINVLTNNINKSSKELHDDSNSHQNKPNNRKRYRRQRESFLQQYARSLTIGEQYNYFSFFQHQVNNYEENNISQIEAENFVNNMFDLVKEAEETNKIYDNINEFKNLDFNSSFYLKSKAMIIKSFSKQIKEQNENINNNIEFHKKEIFDKSTKHIHNLILKKTTNQKIHSTYLLYIEKNIHNIIHEKQEKKEIIRMSLSLFDKLARKNNHNKNNMDIHELKMTKELMLPSYNCILLAKYFDVKQEIEEYIFLQDYIIPKKITYHAQLSRVFTLNKKEYSKMQKIENYICTSYEKKDNMLYVNYFTDKDTTVYLLNDLYKNSDSNYYHKDNNRKLTRFSVCGRPFGNQNPPLKLALPNSRDAKRNSTIHGKNISHTITPQYPHMINANKNNKLCLDNINNKEYNFIRQPERRYTYHNTYKLIPYKDSLLYKLTCINNQTINISFKKDGSTCKEYLKTINTNKSLISNDSFFMRKNETNVNQTEKESSPQKEKLPEFKTSIILPSFIQTNKPDTNLNKLPSSLSKVLIRTVDKNLMNNQIGNNLYKIIMYHIANNNTVIVETIILDNKDRLQMNYQDEEGNTFLICAIKNKCNSLIKFLLESGCDPNLPNHYKNYPLHYAVSLQNYEIVNTLIAYGAQEKSVNTKGLVPWQCIGISLD